VKSPAQTRKSIFYIEKPPVLFYNPTIIYPQQDQEAIV